MSVEAGYTAHEADVLARLTRIEQRLQDGDRRFGEFARHVEDCTEEKRNLLAAVASLKGQLSQMDKAVTGLRVAVFAFLGGSGSVWRCVKRRRELDALREAPA